MADVHHFSSYITRFPNGYFHKKYRPESWSSQIETNSKAEFGQVIEQFDMCRKEIVVSGAGKVVYVEQSNRLATFYGVNVFLFCYNLRMLTRLKIYFGYQHYLVWPRCHRISIQHNCDDLLNDH